MRIIRYITGMLETNTYAVVSEANSAVIIDPGDDGQKITEELKNKDIEIKKILLTHGHFDHTKDCAEIVKLTGAAVYIHSDDAIKLTDKNHALPFGVSSIRFKPVMQYETVKDGDIIKQDELSFKVIHTPGHTAGSVVYAIGDTLFTGDTLFVGTVGATHDPSSSFEALMDSVNRLKNLEGDFAVLPGHAETGTMEQERKYNPYLNGSAGTLND